MIIKIEFYNIKYLQSFSETLNYGIELSCKKLQDENIPIMFIFINEKMKVNFIDKLKKTLEIKNFEIIEELNLLDVNEIFDRSNVDVILESILVKFI